MIAAVSEIVGGLLIAVGLLTPLASAIVFGTLFVAAVSTFKNGFWNVNGGGEYPFVLGIVGLVIAFTGPGRYSVDDALGLELSGLQWGVSATVLALAASVPPLVRMRTVRRANATAGAHRAAAV
jgi:putative oxidoreductase